MLICLAGLESYSCICTAAAAAHVSVPKLPLREISWVGTQELGAQHGSADVH